MFLFLLYFMNQSLASSGKAVSVCNMNQSLASTYSSYFTLTITVCLYGHTNWFMLYTVLARNRLVLQIVRV